MPEAKMERIPDEAYRKALHTYGNSSVPFHARRLKEALEASGGIFLTDLERYLLRGALNYSISDGLYGTSSFQETLQSVLHKLSDPPEPEDELRSASQAALDVLRGRSVILLAHELEVLDRLRAALND